MSEETGTTTTETAAPKEAEPQEGRRPRRIIRRRRRKEDETPQVDPNLVQKVLNESGLPKAYSFEIPKTVHKILSCKACHVALQMPEGLLIYATVIADVLKRLVATKTTTPLDVSILGDVTYGACCVDDLGAKAMGCDLLVHYGHSCLVPLQHTVLPCLYVFVEIQIDVPHMVDCLDLTLAGASNAESKPSIFLLGTVQFRHALVEASQLLRDKNYETTIPQAKPLSPGEVLGCTSPHLEAEENSAVVCFVADGRFHLESTLISNPHIRTFYRYDPYSKALTEESYAHTAMKDIRSHAIGQARNATTFGILLGTLGRQGNPGILQRLQTLLRQHKKRFFIMLVSEITPSKLALFAKTSIDAWVQVACPRLSVDWGHLLSDTKPVLSPYELFVCLNETPWQDVYPMDFYSYSGGPWSNYHEDNKQRQCHCGSNEQNGTDGCLADQEKS